jgi:hypothetical protein
MCVFLCVFAGIYITNEQTTYPTNSVGLSPSGEAARRSAIQEFPQILS